MFAGGNFSVTSEVFLFAAGEGESLSRDADQPYGILIGGAELDGEQVAYTLFEIRDDARFRVVRHQAGSVRELVTWTRSDAIASLSEGDTTVENVLAVDAIDERVTFYVNDQQVADLPRSELDPEGLVGLRAGAGVSLHVTSLAIGPNRR